MEYLERQNKRWEQAEQQYNNKAMKQQIKL